METTSSPTVIDESLKQETEDLVIHKEHIQKV
jgi:hypothetical protein